MKKQIAGVAAVIFAATALSVSASAEYYINTERNGNSVKAEVIASGATLPAIEFTVELPDNITVDDIETESGAFYNEDNGRFAWAGTEAPKDGTVMYSVTFETEDNAIGEIVVTPADGYEDDMPSVLTAEIGADDAEDDEEDNEENNTDNDSADNSSEIGAGTSDEVIKVPEDDSNPATGVAVSCTGAAIAAAAAFAAARRNKK